MIRWRISSRTATRNGRCALPTGVSDGRLQASPMACHASSACCLRSRAASPLVADPSPCLLYKVFVSAARAILGRKAILIKRHRFLGAVIALSAVIAACGGDDDDAESTDSTEAPGGDSTAAPGDTSRTRRKRRHRAGRRRARRGRFDHDRPRLRADQPRPAPRRRRRRAADQRQHLRDASRPDADGELIPSSPPRCRRRSTTRRGSSRSATTSTFHDGTPFNADAVVATVERMIGLVGQENTDNDGFYSTLTGADEGRRHHGADHDDRPRRRAPGAHVLAEDGRARTEASDDLSDAPNGTGPYTFVEPRDRRVDRARRQRRLLGRRTVGRVRDVRVRLRGRHPPRRARSRASTTSSPTCRRRTSNRPRSSGQLQGQENPIIILDVDEGITADPNVRKALNLADRQGRASPSRSTAASPGGRQGQLLSPSILGHNDDARAVRLRPRRGQAPDRGGRRRRRDDHARRRVVGPLAERP